MRIVKPSFKEVALRTALYPTYKFLNALAEEAGSTIRKNFSLGMRKEWKNDNTPITATDTTVDNFITAIFKTSFPHIQIISEEGDQSLVMRSEYTAICDPLDGTIPFSHGMPISTFCIAILQNGSPVIAVIHDPFLHRTWYAERGEGSFFENKKMAVSDKKDFKGTVVHALLSATKFPQVHQELENAGALLMNCCSAAYFGGLIASGEILASITTAYQIWETPAMQLIVEEAGGKATDLCGNELDYMSGKINGHIVSNGFVHDQIVKMINP
jgi:fructose-1,6-bisphosphatase/inositol monophosphatase family enzyme